MIGLCILLQLISSNAFAASIKGYQALGCGDRTQVEHQAKTQPLQDSNFCGHEKVAAHFGDVTCKKIPRLKNCKTTSWECITQFYCNFQSKVSSTNEVEPPLQEEIKEAPIRERPTPPAQAIQEARPQPAQNTPPPPVVRTVVQNPETQIATKPQTVESGDLKTIQNKTLPEMFLQGLKGRGVSKNKANASTPEIIFKLFLYVIWAAGMYQLFKKAGLKPWLGIIPMVNNVYLYKIANLSWAYFILPLLLVFIPIIGVVTGSFGGSLGILLVILLGVLIGAFSWWACCHSISKKFGHGFLMTLGLIILPFIFFLYLGFSSRETYSG